MRTQPFWRQAFSSGDDDTISGPFGAASVNADDPTIYGEIIALNDAGTPGTTLPSYCWKEKRAKAGGQYTSDDTLIASGTIATCTLPAGYIATGLLYDIAARVVPLDVGSIVRVRARGTFDSGGLEEWVTADATAAASTCDITDYVTNVCATPGTLTFVTTDGAVTDVLLNGASILEVGFDLITGVRFETHNCAGEITCWDATTTDCCVLVSCCDPIVLPSEILLHVEFTGSSDFGPLISGDFVLKYTYNADFGQYWWIAQINGIVSVDNPSVTGWRWLLACVAGNNWSFGWEQFVGSWSSGISPIRDDPGSPGTPTVLINDVFVCSPFSIGSFLSTDPFLAPDGVFSFSFP